MTETKKISLLSKTNYKKLTTKYYKKLIKLILEVKINSGITNVLSNLLEEHLWGVAVAETREPIFATL